MASFLGVTMADKIGVTELNEILWNCMPSIFYKKLCVQGCDCKSISFKKAVNMFECTGIAESTYEVVLRPSLKK